MKKGARPAAPRGRDRAAKGGLAALLRHAARLRPFAVPVALLAATLVHWPALGTFFAQDDVTFLARARGLSPTPWSLARPLSEGFLWRGLHALFGLNPLPYHAFNFTLHLVNAALVYAIGRILLRGTFAAFAAAVLFGASSVAFTPLHWISGLVEITSTTFTLAAFWAFLAARRQARPSLLWLGAALILAALTSKESVIFFPLVLLAVHLRLAPGGERAGVEAPPGAVEAATPRAGAWTIAPATLAVALYGAAFLSTLERVHYVRSEAYAMTASPVFLFQNLSTYLGWIVSVATPIRDELATVHPEAWPLGLAVLVAIAIGLWLQHRDPRHPAEVGAVWFVAFLAPVVGLEHHTYLYYLYLPWAGFCWMVAAFGQRFGKGRAGGALAVAALLVVFTALEARNVHARRAAMRGTLPLDKTIRESGMLENVVTGLRAAALAPGDSIAFVNPAPARRIAMAGDRSDSVDVESYVPLEAVMRRGETIRLFFPGVTYLGFSRRLPVEWERARTFLYQDEGTVRLLGSRGAALAELGYFSLRAHEWATADSFFVRSLASGDTLADAVFGHAVASGQLGRPGEFERWGREFLRRFPNDSRTAAVESDLRRRSTPAR